MKRTNKISTKTLTLAGLLTAIVVVLQLLATALTRLGVFSVSLTLVPIVIGAATCGPLVGAWLGFAFGIVVLITDSAAFFTINALGTILVVLLKGVCCGLLASLTYKALERVNRYVAVVAAAIVSPITNTGIFLLGCRLFFWDTIAMWGAGLGFESVTAYAFLGLVGANFLFELGFNMVLSPVIVRLLNIRQKQNA